MLFYFLISIVFISEIIITTAIILHLLKLDKSLIRFNNFVSELKPEIKDIMQISEKISEQLVELAPVAVRNIKSIFTNILMTQFKSFLTGLIFWFVKREVEKRV